MTLYPKVRNVKEINLASGIMLIISFAIAITCVIVNLCTSTRYLWCLIVIAGIVYSWITVIYSISRNVNIGSSVTLQFIVISLLVLCIDYIFDYKGWAINLAIPIIIIIANTTMLILTIVSVNRYYKYAIYQLIIVLFSMIPVILIGEKIVENIVLSIIASSISVVNLILTLSLSAKDVKDAIIRKFHM